jgi:hypothetical protein
MRHRQPNAGTFHVKSFGRTPSDKFPEHIALLVLWYAAPLILDGNTRKPLMSFN